MNMIRAQVRLIGFIHQLSCCERFAALCHRNADIIRRAPGAFMWDVHRPGAGSCEYVERGQRQCKGARQSRR